MTQKHILILGAGSIGKRHAKNFSSLGCKVSMVDPREDRLKEAKQLRDENVNIIAVADSMGLALAGTSHEYDGILIGTPPHIHAQQIVDICESGSKIPIFSEKPLTTTLLDALCVKGAINFAGNPFMLGYCWRAAEPIKKLGELIREGKIGKPLHANFTMAAYLHWHPWEDYRDFFVSKHSWGGGALYENHWLDLMLWWWGMPNELVAICDKISDLELEEGTDDNVDVIFSYNNGLRVTLHLDLYSKPHNKSIEIVGEKGTLRWSFKPNHLGYMKSESPAGYDDFWDYLSEDRNDMFLAEAQGFLDMIDGKTEPMCGLEDGIRVLKIIELIRQSAEEKRAVKCV